ncbi:MAG: bifunctional heptose 7-phosphate kinase/heptose 1-phosphate adenyltransferase, partial [bacterium]
MKELVESFKTAKVGVIGDLILDRYTWGSVDRISPEAPVPVMNVDRESRKLGGAGNAAQTISKIGAQATVLGRLGDDRAGERIRSMMDQKGIELIEIPNHDEFPTIRKTRFIAGSQHVLRVDEEDRTALPEEGLNQSRESIVQALNPLDAVLLSDYAKGVFSRNNLPIWLEICNEASVKVVVDPHVRHFKEYRDVSLLTPNKSELREGLGIVSSDETSLEG